MAGGDFAGQALLMELVEEGIEMDVGCGSQSYRPTHRRLDTGRIVRYVDVSLSVDGYSSVFICADV